MVESQHIASTMKLVDTSDEQDLLETLLEASKPPAPTSAEELNYLLATPFRYDPLRGGSRFRGTTDLGVFYGAQTVRTAGAELGYWRWKFVQESEDIDRLEPVAHTAFHVDVSTQVIDLQKQPFNRDAEHWMHPTDYGATQALAQMAREANVGGIVYRSVRDPEPAWCLALLDPAGFAMNAPHPETQTWYLAVTPREVILRRDNEALRFATEDW
jgi:hypothetical protein